MGLKSIFDGLYVDQLIQKDEQGAFVFYPHGMMGRGYRLPAELEPGIRRRLRRHMLVALILGATYGIFVLRLIDSADSFTSLGWAIISVVAVLNLAGITYFRRPLTQGLEPVSGPRPSAGEWFRRGRQARPSWTYWTSAVMGVFMLFVASLVIALALADGDPVTIVCAIVTLASGALLTWDGTLGVMDRWLTK